VPRGERNVKLMMTGDGRTMFVSVLACGMLKGDEALIGSRELLDGFVGMDATDWDGKADMKLRARILETTHITPIYTISPDEPTPQQQ